MNYINIFIRACRYNNDRVVKNHEYQFRSMKYRYTEGIDEIEDDLIKFIEKKIVGACLKPLDTIFGNYSIQGIYDIKEYKDNTDLYSENKQKIEDSLKKEHDMIITLLKRFKKVLKLLRFK